MKTVAKKAYNLANSWIFGLEGGPIRQGWVSGTLEVIFGKYITIPCQEKNLNEKYYFFVEKF